MINTIINHNFNQFSSFGSLKTSLLACPSGYLVGRWTDRGYGFVSELNDMLMLILPNDFFYLRIMFLLGRDENDDDYDELVMYSS